MKTNDWFVPHSHLSHQFPTSLVILDNLRCAQSGGREKKSFDMKGYFFRITWGQNRHMSVKGGKNDKCKERPLTYSFLCAVFAVPGVAKYGIGQLLAESHVKIPQFDLTTFKPLPGSTVSPTATDEGRKGIRGRDQSALAYSAVSGMKHVRMTNGLGEADCTSNTDIEQLM